ncbi:MAG: hypothetical protein AB8G18_01330 [Gammaproteobacteria bacterium]
MKKMLAVLIGGMLLLAPAANAYSIKHSYSAAGNATEYHGMCASGEEIVMIEKANGAWSYEGPSGDGTVQSGDLDKVARKACGE